MKLSFQYITELSLSSRLKQLVVGNRRLMVLGEHMDRVSFFP